MFEWRWCRHIFDNGALIFEDFTSSSGDSLDSTEHGQKEHRSVNDCDTHGSGGNDDPLLNTQFRRAPRPIVGEVILDLILCWIVDEYFDSSRCQEANGFCSPLVDERERGDDDDGVVGNGWQTAKIGCFHYKRRR